MLQMRDKGKVGHSRTLECQLRSCPQEKGKNGGSTENRIKMRKMEGSGSVKLREKTWEHDHCLQKCEGSGSIWQCGL